MIITITSKLNRACIESQKIEHTFIKMVNIRVFKNYDSSLYQAIIQVDKLLCCMITDRDVSFPAFLMLS